VKSERNGLFKSSNLAGRNKDSESESESSVRLASF